MKCDVCGLPMREQSVTYTIQVDDKLVVVEHVPAKVCANVGNGCIVLKPLSDYRRRCGNSNRRREFSKRLCLTSRRSRGSFSAA